MWDSFTKGEPESLESIFRMNYPYLIDYGLRMIKHEDLVKDCIQDMFAYLWEKRQTLSKVHSIRAYLIVVLRRTLLKAKESQSKMQLVLQEIVYEYEDRILPFDDLLIKKEKEETQKQALKTAIQEIPERIREALYLKTYQQLSYNEISDIMGVRNQVARNYVSGALKRLQEIIKIKP